MKQIVITFDDGRADNYSVAARIMKRYKMVGTVFVTTGYVDKSWEGYPVLEAPSRGLHPIEIKKLSELGWEIGLHGDRHTTNLEDFKTSYEKMEKWLGYPGNIYGYSVPNSDASVPVLNKLKERYGDNRLLYIRRGRRLPNTSLKLKMLYVLSYYGKLQFAYNRYNKENVVCPDDQNTGVFYSVVVKRRDDPRQIIRFIEQLEDNSKVVLMFHSVLPKSILCNHKSNWIYSADHFSYLCRELSLVGEVVTLANLYRRNI